MGRKPKHIGQTLSRMIKDLGYDKKLDQVRALELWPEIVGEQIASISTAERVDNGVLYIKVKSMTWRTELLFQREKILQMLEQHIGRRVISDIRFY